MICDERDLFKNKSSAIEIVYSMSEKINHLDQDNTKNEKKKCMEEFPSAMREYYGG